MRLAGVRPGELPKLHLGGQVPATAPPEQLGRKTMIRLETDVACPPVQDAISKSAAGSARHSRTLPEPSLTIGLLPVEVGL